MKNFGRGILENASGRFEKISVGELSTADLAAADQTDFYSGQDAPPPTEFFRDHSKTVIVYNSSPDIGFKASVNPYRGCEHGCVYCYARPTHGYLGLSSGRDFETKIFVKSDAPDLLRKELQKRSWHPQVVALSGVTDCYQPIERQLKLTRACLSVLAEHRNPCVIITKNHLVTRDIDILQQMAAHRLIGVMLSVTTLDRDLSLRMEPRTSQPRLRLEAVTRLRNAGIPVGVMVAPVIPGLTDQEIPAILKAAAAAGAQQASYGVLRLPYEIKEAFPQWLEKNFPLKKEKVLACLRDLRGGELNDPRFGTRMRGEGVYARHIGDLFKLQKRRHGLDGHEFELSTSHFCIPSSKRQMDLWQQGVC